ncbi:MAG: gamma-glutamyl-gamma-aminobutyrate hydrolase family protein [Nannocystaceae bacterium]|nr:gamma-glutamyl-gamma-aminobutyrate hydrolase family protein [Nannocystaceae bacterium]
MTTVRVGISANFFHADPQRPVFRHKTLQYLEERMALALWHAGAVPLLLPDLKHEQGLSAMIDAVDGLVLAGGADVSPTSYGETPLRDTWRGDAVRDAYECELVRIARARGVPVLGVCRGIQLLNVALGGTLWQDIGTQVDRALVHRDWDRYDENGHGLRLAPGSWISRIYGGATTLEVNSVHHQAIRTLAPGLRATAWAPDGIIEAVELAGDEAAAPLAGPPLLTAVQWHPEWLEAERTAPGGEHDGRAVGAAIFRDFVLGCARRRRG